MQGVEVLGDVAAEVGRVIGVDRDLHPALEHLQDVVLGHVVEHAELGVGQRAHSQRDLLVDDPLHQPLVFEGTYTVVDALDLQQVQGFPDVLRRAFFTGVGDGQEAFAARAVEYPLELARRVAHFRTVQAHGDECIAKRQRLVEGLLRLFFAQVAQETEDQAAGDAQLLLAIFECAGDAVEHHFERHATVGVGLRVEEGFGVDHVLFFAAQQVGPGQVVEVLGGAQHVGALVVQVEEFLQVVEGVGLAQGLDVAPGQGDLVAFGQGEQQFRFQGTFQVQVQLGLGQGVQPVIHGVVSSGAGGRCESDALPGPCPSVGNWLWLAAFARFSPGPKKPPFYIWRRKCSAKPDRGGGQACSSSRR